MEWFKEAVPQLHLGNEYWKQTTAKDITTLPEKLKDCPNISDPKIEIGMSWKNAVQFLVHDYHLNL